IIVAPGLRSPHPQELPEAVDFHLSLIFVNLSLLVLSLTTGSATPADERAILADADPVAGRLEIDPMRGVVFRSSDGDTVLPARSLRKVVQTSPPFIAPGTSPAHRVNLWGNESISGTVQSLDETAVQLRTAAGELVRVPLYLISKIEHFHG